MGSTKSTTIVANDPADRTGNLKRLGGSASDAFNNVLANSTIHTLWMKGGSPDDQNRQMLAAIATLVGIAPHDELEGMLAGQLVAANAAAMECYRRAMIPEQTSESRRENLTQGGKLSRTYAVLLEALNRHRGKGQQKVTVEHVHVHPGAQAVVGTVETGGGVSAGKERQPHAKLVSHAPEPPLWCEDQKREPMPIASDAKRPLSNARRSSTRSTERRGERRL